MVTIPSLGIRWTIFSRNIVFNFYFLSWHENVDNIAVVKEDHPALT